MKYIVLLDPLFPGRIIARQPFKKWNPEMAPVPKIENVANDMDVNDEAIRKLELSERREREARFLPSEFVPHEQQVVQNSGASRSHPRKMLSRFLGILSCSTGID